MSDDALTDGVETQQTQETAPAAPAAAQTAADQPEAELDFSPESLPEKERQRLQKWADNYAAEQHRKRLNETGNSLQRVSSATKEKLKKNPSYLEELEAERDAFRRAALASERVGLNGGEKQEPEPEEEESSIEADAKAVLTARGFTEQSDAWAGLLAFEIEHLKAAERRAHRILKKAAVKPTDEDQLLAKLTEKQRKAQMESDWADITSSDEWNDPDKGPEFEGRVRRKAQEAAAEGKPFTLRQIAESVRQEMNPKKPAPQARVSLGSTSSGKVAATAKSDPWAQFKEECKAKGIDPDKF